MDSWKKGEWEESPTDRWTDKQDLTCMNIGLSVALPGRVARNPSMAVVVCDKLSPDTFTEHLWYVIGSHVTCSRGHVTHVMRSRDMYNEGMRNVIEVM